MITKDQIYTAQKNWGDGIVKIGTLMNDESACFKFTSSFLNNIYDFKNSEVLFKPTKASKEQFRPKIEMALSYFLGGKDSFCIEDEGFALKPWVDVKIQVLLLKKTELLQWGIIFLLILRVAFLKLNTLLDISYLEIN